MFLNNRPPSLACCFQKVSNSLHLLGTMCLLGITFSGKPLQKNHVMFERFWLKCANSVLPLNTVVNSKCLNVIFEKINIANNNYNQKMHNDLMIELMQWKAHSLGGSLVDNKKKYSLAEEKELGESNKNVILLLLFIPSLLLNLLYCIFQPLFI